MPTDSDCNMTSPAPRPRVPGHRTPESRVFSRTGLLGLAVLFWILASIGTLLSGCEWIGPADPGDDGTTYSDTLRISVFQHYMDPAVIDSFSREYDIHVEEHFHTTNNQLLDSLDAGRSYDLLMVSDYVIPHLIENERIYRMRNDSIPNRSYLNQQFTSLDFDFGSLYSIPVFWGTLGLTYHSNRISGIPLSWERFYHPADHSRGYLTAMPDMRYALGSALIYLGYSPNTTRESRIDSAAQVIEQQKQYLRDFQEEYMEDSLTAGKVMMSQIWSGTAAYAMSQNNDLRYVLPSEGVIFFVDNFVIPRTSARRSEAESFINFMLEPHNMARHTNYGFYANTVSVSRRYIKSFIAQGPAYINPFIMPNVYQLESLDPEVEALYEAAWDSLNIDEFSGFRPPPIIDHQEDALDRN